MQAVRKTLDTGLRTARVSTTAGVLLKTLFKSYYKLWPSLQKQNTMEKVVMSFIYSRYFYSVSSSPLLLRGAPNYSTDTVSELTRWSTTGNYEWRTWSHGRLM